MAAINKKQKEKLQGQTNQIFNIAEKIIMQYIADFLGESHEIIFKDALPTYVEPLILLPIDDYKKNICIKFDMDIANYSQNDHAKRIANIKKLLIHEKVREGLGFLFYCIKNVYSAVLASSLINNKPLLNMVLELDEERWCFVPKYYHDLSHKKRFHEIMLNTVLQQKYKQDGEINPELNKKLHELIQKIKTLQNDITPEIKQTEHDINESYDQKPVIVISLIDIHKTKLPNPKNKQAPLPQISQTQYEDPN
jgi:hypothetical protein